MEKKRMKREKEKLRKGEINERKGEMWGNLIRKE